jgi:hypothetical protein
MRLLRTTALSLALLFAFSPVYGQHHHSSSRPYYGGGKHTKSHRVIYQGSQNSNHKGGHYRNPKTGRSLWPPQAVVAEQDKLS